MGRNGTIRGSLAAKVPLQFLIVKILDSPGLFVRCLLEFAGLSQMHFGQVLILDVAEVGVAVVDEFALDRLVVLLVADYPTLVVLSAVLLYHAWTLPS